MKTIKRKGYPSIKKRKINLKNLINYEELDINLLTKLLNEVIVKNTYSTIDLLKLIKDSYKENLKDTVKNIKDYSSVRFNCYYATILLKEKLEKLMINSNIISYKAIGFSTKKGDKLIKEAHVALLIPTKRNYQIYYIILDPGLKIPEPLGFYKKAKKTLLKVDNDNIIIDKSKRKEYPYSIEIKGYNRYSPNKKNYYCKEYFNVDYETLNPQEILFPIVCKILSEYKIIRYSTTKEKRALIKLDLINNYIECSDATNKLKLTFKKIQRMKTEELQQNLTPFADKLDISNKELVETIKFIIKHNKEFITSIIDKEILKELNHKK